MKKKIRPMVKGYSEAGASLTRRSLKGFVPASGSPLEDISFHAATLRQRSRMLYMASPLATSAINTNRTKVVGIGLSLKASVDKEILGITAEKAKEWQRKTEAEWRLWASKKQNCDAIGMNSFSELQQLALKSWLMSGDVFPLVKRYDPTPVNPYSLRIHLIEADRVCTPTKLKGSGIALGPTEGRASNGNDIHDGVEVDADGRVVAYYICNTYPFQVVGTEEVKWQRIEAYSETTGLPNILQVMDSERPDQYRGVPYLAQVIEPLLQLRRYTESELTSALIQSFFTAWVQTETNPGDIPFNEVGGDLITGIPGENPDAPAENDNVYEMGPGTVTTLQPGEKIEFGSPNIPTAGFETFVKTICKLVGAALELPYDVLVKEFNSSYSASRGALLEAWEAFRMRREWFVNDFCQPIYEIWLSEAVARGRIVAPGFFEDPLIRAAWCGARWIGPVQGQLDPKKEVDAAIRHINYGLKTHEQVAREMGGGDWEENVIQLKRENELLKDAGSRIWEENRERTDVDAED